MADVFLAQDTEQDRKVALKFLSAEMQKDPTARSRFVREANLGRALEHPNICKIHEADEVEGRTFIVMEYVEGETIQERLQKGRMPLPQALDVARAVAEALEEAHAKGYIHRDIKPSNFILTVQGQTKLTDFGLAKRLLINNADGSAEWLTTLTDSGAAVGTLAYMSPEQLRGKPADARTDIFSLGVVLYEMLTGVHPFMKSGPMETASAILRENPAPLARYSEEVEDSLQQIVKKMLAKEPQERYQLIREVRVALGELISDP